METMPETWGDFAGGRKNWENAGKRRKSKNPETELCEVALTR